MTSFWNGSGQVVRADGQGRTGALVWQDATAAGADTITDADHDSHDEGMADTVQKCLNLDGENSPTADIAWGTNKITGLKAATAATDAANLGQVQAGAVNWGGTAAGTANALTLTLSPAITTYANGQRFEWIVASDNTGAATMNVNALGDVALESAVGVALVGGQLKAGRHVGGVYVGTTPSIVITHGLVEEVPLPRGYIDGFQTSSDAGDTEHDILIGAGAARASDDSRNIPLASAIAKQIDAAWAVGDDAGGMDTGAVEEDSWYAIHAIRRLDTLIEDALFSLADPPTSMPTDYTVARRVSWVRTDGDANIIPYSQRGEEFLWTDPPRDVNSTGINGTASLHTLSAPPNTEAIINVMIESSGGVERLYISPTDVTDEGPSESAAPLATLTTQSTSTQNGQPAQFGPIRVRVDENSQVRLRGNSGLTQVRIATLGWIDRRGKDA